MLLVLSPKPSVGVASSPGGRRTFLSRRIALAREPELRTQNPRRDPLTVWTLFMMGQNTESPYL